MTDTMTRDQQLLEEFKEGLEKDGPIVLAGRVAELEGQLATATSSILNLEEKGDDLRARAEAAEKARDKALAGEKRAKAKVADGPKPASPRRLKAMELDADERTELHEAIAEADGVEIAFVGGDCEIAGLAPKLVDGEQAWQKRGRDLVLVEPIDLEGPATGTSVSIDGYALLIDGKQAAWCPRAEPLRVAPGQKVQIVDDIRF